MFKNFFKENKQLKKEEKRLLRENQNLKKVNWNNNLKIAKAQMLARKTLKKLEQEKKVKERKETY